MKEREITPELEAKIVADYDFELKVATLEDGLEDLLPQLKKSGVRFFARLIVEEWSQCDCPGCKAELERVIEEECLPSEALAAIALVAKRIEDRELALDAEDLSNMLEAAVGLSTGDEARAKRFAADAVRYMQEMAALGDMEPLYRSFWDNAKIGTAEDVAIGERALRKRLGLLDEVPEFIARVELTIRANDALIPTNRPTDEQVTALARQLAYRLISEGVSLAEAKIDLTPDGLVLHNHPDNEDEDEGTEAAPENWGARKKPHLH